MGTSGDSIIKPYWFRELGFLHFVFVFFSGLIACVDHIDAWEENKPYSHFHSFAGVDLI